MVNYMRSPEAWWAKLGGSERSSFRLNGRFMWRLRAQAARQHEASALSNISHAGAQNRLRRTSRFGAHPNPLNGAMSPLLYHNFLRMITSSHEGAWAGLWNPVAAHFFTTA